LSDNEKPLARLLIVDDDSDIVQVLKMGLLKNGFLSFKSDAKSYCLVLSDIRMPSISGIQLSKKSKKLIQMSRLF
jgi:DNA-binding NtrC family response regulator